MEKEKLATIKGISGLEEVTVEDIQGVLLHLLPLPIIMVVLTLLMKCLNLVVYY